MMFLILLACTLVSAQDPLLHGLDANGMKVTFYPASMMLSTNPKALVFFKETKLINIVTHLDTKTKGSAPKIANACSPDQKQFLDRILTSVHSVQRITRRLMSLPGATHLVECDSYLRRYYHYATGLASRMRCPRKYMRSLTECKSWALANCQQLSPHEKTWLRHRSRRSSWACHAGLFGLFRAIYTSTGGSCESNHVTNIKEALSDVTDGLDILRSMVKVVNGKTIYLAKTTDALVTKVNLLQSSLINIDKTLTAWQEEFVTVTTKETCHFNVLLEFVSKYSMQVNKAFASLLRLTEIEDLIRQTATLHTKELVGSSHFPRFVATEILSRLETVPEMSLTAKAFKDGFPVIMTPMVDYELHAHKSMELSILVTAPVIATEEAFCVVEYLVPLKYNISGTCFAGPMSRDDLALISCPSSKVLIKSSALSKCLRDEMSLLCPDHVLHATQDVSWLGLPWAPHSRMSFTRSHERIRNCDDLRDLIHLGGRYYLSTTSSMLMIKNGSIPMTLPLSPLMVYHLPCDFSFSTQITGFGACPSRLQIDVPLFTESQVAYVPWHAAMDNSTLHLHYKSLQLTPPLRFNANLTQALDNTFNNLDRQLGNKLLEVREDISKIRETSTTTLNDVLTYMALSLGLLNLILVTVLCLIARQYLFVARNQQRDTEVPVLKPNQQNKVHSCKGCHRPIQTKTEDAEADED